VSAVGSMKKVNFKGHTLSQLVLGTAQFGFDYGIANQVGRPSYQAVLKILEQAFEGGVNALDTAALYGESEVVLGRALKDLGLRDRAFVITKFPWVHQARDEHPGRFLERGITRALGNLGLDRLPLCLFHRYDDLPYLDAALALKEKGYVEHVGVSVYEPEQALEALSLEGIEAIQIPTNILDRRFLRCEIPTRAERRGIAVFVRSVYLQGVLGLSDDDLPDFLQELHPVRRELAQIAGDQGLASLALRFVASLPGVLGVLTGLETLAQLEENLSWMGQGELRRETMERIDRAIPDLPRRLLDMRQWPNA
jgi:aryl-alcohol dehydrogenase-like predicted oxidoreductase